MARDIEFAKLIQGQDREEEAAAAPSPSRVRRFLQLSLVPLLALAAVAGALTLLRPRTGGGLESRLDRPGEALQAYDATACQQGQLPPIPTVEPDIEPIHLKVLTYNLFWWNLYGVRKGNGASASMLIKNAGDLDMMGFQECEDPARVLREAGLTEKYNIFPGDGSKTSAICMAYHKERWFLLGQGMEVVASDDLGGRSVQWMRLKHGSGLTAFFMNHHGPLPVNSGGKCGGPATAFNMLHVLKSHTMPEDVIILVGDFNANGQSQTIQHLEWRLSRVYNGLMGGGIDNIFTNLNGRTVSETSNLGDGGSDHDALSVVFKIGRKPRQRPWWWPSPLPLPSF